jgi:large subunit ribosomal protein L5
MNEEKSMRRISVDKVTLNFGAGNDQKKLAKGVQLLRMISGKEPVKTKTVKRIPSWGLRPGLPIGCKITLRGAEAKKMITRLVASKENKFSKNAFDDNGNVSFGVHEYVDVPEAKYDPELGIMGFEASITLIRPGFRIKTRKIMKRKIPTHHRITKDDSINYFKENYGVLIKEELAEDDDE